MKPRDPITPRTAPRLTRVWRSHGGLIIGALAIVVLAAIVWSLLSGTASTKREVAATPMLMLPPPPPPPPPEPEKLPEPQPDKVKPEVADIKPSAVDKPQDDSPSPSKDNSDPVTIKGDAQAGGDAFGVRAGSGGGSSGSGNGGVGNSTYSRYVSSVLQQALARDPRTRQLVFDDIRLDVWLAADGKTARVQLVQGTGNVATDEAVLAMVRDLDRIDERPPASMRFPMRVSMKGRRP